MTRVGKPSPLERFLSLFAEVQAGEGITTLLLTLDVFLLLTAYYVIKPVREGLILTEGSAEIKSYAAAGQAVLLLGVVPLYAALSSRVPRRILINAVTLFFAGCLVLFYALGRLHVPLGVVFYLWVGIFNLMVVAQFWSFANDLYTPGEGKRLFAIVGFGASAGAVLGSTVVKKLIGKLGVYPPFLVAAGILLVALVLNNLVESREGGRPRRGGTPVAAGQPLARGDAFRLVLRTPYLLLIAVLILVLNWVNSTGEYVLGKVLTDTARLRFAGAGGDVEALTGAFIVDFYAGFYTVVNLVSLLVQLFLVSRILKYLGVRIALFMLPVIALGGYAVLAAAPILVAVRWVKVAENSIDYSLQNTLRGVLFLPTSREEKYKAKQAIDTFFVRTGDVLSAGLVALGTQVLGLGVRGFAAMNLGLAGIWLVLAFWIGLRFTRLVREKEASARDAA